MPDDDPGGAGRADLSGRRVLHLSIIKYIKFINRISKGPDYREHDV